MTVLRMIKVQDFVNVNMKGSVLYQFSIFKELLQFAPDVLIQILR